MGFGRRVAGALQTESLPAALGRLRWMSSKFSRNFQVRRARRANRLHEGIDAACTASCRSTALKRCTSTAIGSTRRRSGNYVRKHCGLRIQHVLSWQVDPSRATAAVRNLHPFSNQAPSRHRRPQSMAPACGRRASRHHIVHIGRAGQLGAHMGRGDDARPTRSGARSICTLEPEHRSCAERHR